MNFSSGLLFGLLLLIFEVASVIGQDASQLVGTWSSGSQAVITGIGFANPENLTFTYPKNTGVCYSFTSDGFYEIARYRFLANGTMPECITGVLQWVHGNFTLLSNNSIYMVPFGDGFQQIQDPCAAQSNFIDPSYNYTELYEAWGVTQDAQRGPTLQLYEADGTPVAPLYQVTNSPSMLPTTVLRNKPPAPATTSAGLISGGGSKRELTINHGKRWVWDWGNWH